MFILVARDVYCIVDRDVYCIDVNMYSSANVVILYFILNLFSGKQENFQENKKI